MTGKRDYIMFTSGVTFVTIIRDDLLYTSLLYRTYRVVLIRNALVPRYRIETVSRHSTFHVEMKIIRYC